MVRTIIAVTLVSLVGCAQQDTRVLTAEERAAIAAEVRQAFQQKSRAIQALDIEAALDAFDRDAPPVHMVDGQMWVGMDEIEPAYRQGLEPVQSFIGVDIRREELTVLGPKAASYAFSFDERFVTEAGDTVDVQGVWTLVFGKRGESWKVVHSSASHGGG